MLLIERVEYIYEKSMKGTGNICRGTFVISDVKSVTGRLGYIAETSLWLQYMIPFIHTSIAWAL